MRLAVLLVFAPVLGAAWLLGCGEPSAGAPTGTHSNMEQGDGEHAEGGASQNAYPDSGLELDAVTESSSELPPASSMDTADASNQPEDAVASTSRTFAVTYPGGCVIDETGEIQCWGMANVGALVPPAGQFERIGAERIGVCGLRTDGSIRCFSTADNSVNEEGPDGVFVDLAVGEAAVCGIRGDGTVACRDPDVEIPPPDEFLDVSAGRRFACGIRARDRGIACWGLAGDAGCNLAASVGQTDPPEGEFAQLSAKGQHACAVRTNGELACWGAGKHYDVADSDCPLAEHFGQSDPPAGRFVQVAVGDNHGCALRVDGTVACWGAGSDPEATAQYPHARQAVAPEGEFIELSADVTRTCGLRRSGGIQCWGSDYGGGLTPPAGFE